MVRHADAETSADRPESELPLGASVSEADGRASRLGVGGFVLSMIALVPWSVAIAFAVGLLPDLSDPGSALSKVASVGMFSTVLSIPGWLLSRRALRVARKRQARTGLAKAGLVLGIVGTAALVLFLVLAIVFFALFYWGVTHDPSFGE